MKKSFKIISAILSLLLLFTGCAYADKPEPVATDAAETQALPEPNELSTLQAQPGSNPSQGATAFAMSLFREASKSNEGSFLVSPLSAYLALAMASYGAQGSTLSEMENTLGSSITDIIAFANEEVIRLTCNSENAIVSLANSVWIDSKFAVSEQYVNDLLSYFAAQSYQGVLNSTQTKAAINEWVKTQTHELIPELLKDNLSADSALALINTLYMKADWQSQFDANDTKDEVFIKDDNSQSTVPMMRREGSISYLALPDGGQAISLPYRDCALSFLAILPPEGVSAGDYIASLSPELLQECLKAAECDVRLGLPKFDTETAITMNDMLKAMGIELAFKDDGSADFSAMCGNATDRLYISSVLQKVKLTVGEEGTEAAAATGIFMEKATAMLEPPEWIELTFNRSFVYAIVDTQSTMPLFIGTQAG